MNTFSFRGALIDNRCWPVDVAIRNGLTIETRAGAYIDEAIFESEDDDIEYFRAKFRLTRDNDE